MMFIVKTAIDLVHVYKQNQLYQEEIKKNEEENKILQDQNDKLKDPNYYNIYINYK